MSALRRAMEIDFKDKNKHKSQGVYLLTTGIPDQETVSISTGLAFSKFLSVLISTSFFSSQGGVATPCWQNTSCLHI